MNNYTDESLYKKTCSRPKYYLIYTSLFFLMAAIVFLCFLKNHYQFIWIPDGLDYYSSWKELGSVGLMSGEFTFQKGLGAGYQIIGFIKAIFYPVYLLTYIQSSDNFELLYTIRVLAGFYLSGITFSIFARKFNKKLFPVLSGAMTYIFSGYLLCYGVRHPSFSETIVVFLPLLVLGIEKVLRREKNWLLIVVVFLLSLGSIYFLYMATILAAIFFIIRFFTIPVCYGEKNVRSFFRHLGQIVLAYLLGVMMGAVSWMPSMLAISSNGRIGKQLQESLALYDLSYYQNLMKEYFSGYIMIWGFPATAFPAIASLFISRRVMPGNKTIRTFWIIGTICTLIPFFGYICSGFNNITNRWSIGYTLVIAIAVMYLSDMIDTMKNKHIIIWSACFVLYAGVCIMFGGSLSLYLGLILIAIVLFAIFVLNKTHNDIIKKKTELVVLLLTCISLIINANILYSRYGSDYQTSFLHQGEADSTYMGNSLEGLAAYLERNQDQGFFRVAANDILTTSTNGYMAYDLNGVAEFNSSNLSYTSYLVENDNAGVQDITAKHGMDNRTAMMELAAVKYYSADASSGYAVPYGYEKSDVIETNSGIYDIYTNTYALPLGYTYSSYILREEYEKMDVLDRQTALLQAVLLEENTDQVKHENNIEKSYIKNTILSVSYDNVEIEDGVIYIGFGGSITYTIEPESGELYIYVDGMHLEDSSRSWNVDAYTDSSYATAYFHGDNYTYYANSDKLLNLGYFEVQDDTITITFSRRGAYSIDHIDVLTQPMDQYQNYINNLKSESMTDIQVSGDVITGHITVKDNKIMCFSIPYNTARGWIVYVDGQKTEVFQANSMYMGINISSGEHDIRLEYHSPLLLECGMVSIGSAIIFIVLLLIAYKREKNIVKRLERED